MHLSSLDNMRSFKEKFLLDKTTLPLKIVDLGSMDIFGCYRPIFNERKWDYVGVDLSPGNNVDIVLSDPYNWLELESGSCDVLISGQTFEHIEYFWKTMLEIARVLKPGGLCCIIAPSGGPEHKYPVDCWRFYPDGFEALARYANLDVLSVHTNWEIKGYRDDSDVWADTCFVARKPQKIKKQTDEVSYDRVVETDTEDSLAKISKYLKPDSNVLELGPAKGYFTKYLKENFNCQVDCVEMSSEMAGEARKYCRKMVVADLDEVELSEHFGNDEYDFILLADILEHIRKGAKVLLSCREMLAPDGRLIVSVPNISHSSVIGCLFEGKFEYRDQGLLDKTHIKFFTRDSIKSLLLQCGYEIEVIDTVTILPEDTQLGDSLMNLPVSLQKMILNREDALTYQYILICRASGGKSSGEKNDNREKVAAVDLRRCHLNSLNQRIAELDMELSEARSCAEAFQNKNATLNIRMVDMNDALVKEKDLSGIYERRISELEDHTEQLNINLQHYQSIIHRIEKHPVYRIYRKLKDLLMKHG